MRDIENMEPVEDNEVLVLINDPMYRDSRSHVRAVFNDRDALQEFANEHIPISEKAGYRVNRHNLRD
jgi:hypothetical protein